MGARGARVAPFLARKQRGSRASAGPRGARVTPFLARKQRGPRASAPSTSQSAEGMLARTCQSREPAAREAPEKVSRDASRQQLSAMIYGHVMTRHASFITAM
ncbi:hypothetical protein NDU88_000791 [Pleurodeles waltl]|uniref:Uncharacterized protein n=1 Tax=Pleurodeles waltl TaxID=8319 RepID=A0AAV7MHV9_PLEWA|nr:hypothetical protein NDU88_000791 [Pleurodeles waltl]